MLVSVFLEAAASERPVAAERSERFSSMQQHHDGLKRPSYERAAPKLRF
jgi:hypothetical protein